MIVMTFGTFDKFHPGHEYYLGEAKKLGGILITVVARDKNVEIMKHKKSHDSEQVRIKNVLDSHISDTVILGSLEDPYNVIGDYKPDILCFGYDQNSFNDARLDAFLQSHNLHPKIIRIPAFNPEKWKSSLL